MVNWRVENTILIHFWEFFDEFTWNCIICQIRIFNVSENSGEFNRSFVVSRDISDSAKFALACLHLFFEILRCEGSWEFGFPVDAIHKKTDLIKIFLETTFVVLRVGIIIFLIKRFPFNMLNYMFWFKNWDDNMFIINFKRCQVLWFNIFMGKLFQNFDCSLCHSTFPCDCKYQWTDTFW